MAQHLRRGIVAAIGRGGQISEACSSACLGPGSAAIHSGTHPSSIQRLLEAHWPQGRPTLGTLVGWHQLLHTSSASLAGKDYYDVLGVSKSATDQEVKKAYYGLAKKYHPDTNKDNAAAAATFQEVQKAYEALRDPEKRRIYDQVGREGMDRMESGGYSEGPGMGGAGGFPGFAGFEAASIFEQLFSQDPMMGGMFSRVMIQPIRISFMDAVKGTKRKVTLSGIGGMDNAVEVDIPPGVDSGDHVEVVMDMPAQRGRRPTKARVAIPIEVAPHEVLRRQGPDVFLTLEVKLTEALLGTSTTVQTIEGKSELVVPPGTQHGDKLRMRGKGIYNPRRGIKGDQFVEIKVTLPKSLNDKQRELLKQFEAEEVGKRSWFGKK